jgi:DNA repair protein RadC
VNWFKAFYRRLGLAGCSSHSGRRTFITLAARRISKAGGSILNASAVIVAHNHPSGDPTPSRDDVEMTRQLKAAAEAVGLDLHDHVVIGHGRHVSFRSAGLL